MNQTADIKAKMDDFVGALRNDIRNQALHIPTLPDTAVQALFVINDPESSAHDLAGVVTRDAAMATRLVHFANSPIFRGSDPCSSIKAAIIRIGLDKTRDVITALAMKDVFSTAHPVLAARMERLWSHSMEVAALAMILASRHPHLDPDTALLAGLIHDIGAIPIINKASTAEFLYDDERLLDQTIAALHGNLGRAILKVWNFEPYFIEVAGEHDNLKRDPGTAPVDYVDIVTAANVESYIGTTYPLAATDRLAVPAFRRLGCTRESPDLDWEEAEAAIAEVNRIFTI